MTYNLMTRIAYLAFEDFMTKTSDEQLAKLNADTRPTCLADFIQAWVESGEGVRSCAADYPCFLVAVVHIIDKWMKGVDGDLLDYIPLLAYIPTEEEHAAGAPGVVERHVDSVFGDEHGTGHRILDQSWFTLMAFRHLHPRPESH